MNRKAIAEEIFLAGIRSVLPDRLIAETMFLNDDRIIIGGKSFSIKEIDNIYVIGAGKATALMASAVEKILGKRITGGYISVKYGHSISLKYISVAECGHPFPDENGFRASSEILKIAVKAGINDLVICLLSGGGSALLPDYPPGSSAEEIIFFNKILINSGASISEINTVRKHLSCIKGGQMARAVYPASLVTLILSDVPGDLPEVIASGPASADSTTFQEAIAVLNKYNLTGIAPTGIINYLKEGIKGNIPETPKPGDPVFNKTFNLIIGNNGMALEAAAAKASEFNLKAIVVDDLLQGDVSAAAEKIVITASELKGDRNRIKPLCLLFGGETTVKVKGKGLGGRNQHLALIVALMLRNQKDITVLAVGTDGSDGPTDAAGAVVDSDTIPDAILKNIYPKKFIRKFNSYNFFKEAGGHIITGPTMTNVMDIIVVLIW